MQLQELPREVIHRVISYLPSHRDAAALSTQGRSLHSMCNMPERKKFHKIRICAKDESINSAFGLLMAILERPTLGQHVHHIEYRETPPSDHEYSSEEYERNLDADEMHRLRAAVQKAGFGGAREEHIINMLMQKTIHRGFDPERPGTMAMSTRERKSRGAFLAQAVTVVLIALSPNLTSMALTQPFYAYSTRGRGRGPGVVDQKLVHPLNRFLREANANPDNIPYLQNLRHVYFINDEKSFMEDSRHFISMDFIACVGLFNQLPSMKSMGIDLLTDDENGRQPNYDGSSSISSFRINHSAISTRLLCRAISTCKGLRELQYSTGGREYRGDGGVHFDRLVLFKIICDHKKTFEILGVDAEDHIYSIDPDLEYMEEDEEEEEEHRESSERDYLRRESPLMPPQVPHQTGSLKNFGALKRLRLGIRLLLYFARGVGGSSEEPREEVRLADCLPDSLEHLCILGYKKGQNRKHDVQVEGLMAFYNSGSSHLKEIKGIDEMIPSTMIVADPDEEDQLWKLSEIGY